ncbi:Hypp5729 [Branchiostoma lanceolatum]|uniref:Hypp5729 protein n=1 Tax=Branchiostoma lanceolatum TaxID=7740 RepID=A0A8J9VFY9_BRALA|nr:Hypp5729 [Branchiostoma lanceolatum]
MPSCGVATISSRGIKNKQKKLDVTGVFGAACRHEVPLKLLNMSHGERLVYPVYLIKALLKQAEDNSLKLKVIYNIACVLKAHLFDPGHEGIPRTLQRKAIDALNKKLRAVEERQMLDREMREMINHLLQQHSCMHLASSVPTERRLQIVA